MKKNNGKKNSRKKEKRNRKVDYVILSVLGCMIVFLGITLYYLNNTYFKYKDYMIDYLKFSIANYSEDEDDSNLITKKNGNCNIILFSKIKEEPNLSDFGTLEVINNHSWAKQEFDNGVTWISYYKNIFYIIQMYGKDSEIYNEECKQDFEKIKKTFSFLENE